MRIVRTSWLPSALLLALFACDDGDAHFTTKLASDFTPVGRTVSVLGVYKDGQMSPDAWQTLGPRVAPALGGANCDVGYDMLTPANSALADSIDEYARANGPTDNLLAQLAPAAKGDLVIVLTFAGKLSQRISDAGAAGRAPAPSATRGRGGGRMGGMRGAGRMQGSPKAETATDTELLDISASLFSVSQARSVAMVAMQYSGKSVDDAIAKFAAQLARAFPNAVCVGWNWGAHIDPEHILQSIDR